MYIENEVVVNAYSDKLVKLFMISIQVLLRLSTSVFAPIGVDIQFFFRIVMRQYRLEFADRIHNVSHKLVTVSTTVGILKSYIHGYNHIGLAIAEVKDMLTIAEDYLGQLQLKLNMLSMEDLSPSSIIRPWVVFKIVIPS
jgi:hypothetical protein